MQIKGKRIVLTGAASGIGRALLRQLAYYDAEIIAADHDAVGLGDAVREPVNVRASLNPFVCDIATQSGTDELFAHALAALGGIDIFIANAHLAYYERLQDADWSHIAAIYNVNTFSPIYSAVKMAELNPDNRYLTVLTASTMAHWGMAGHALYSSTKAALHRFADAYRAELPDNGRLMLVYPASPRPNPGEAPLAPDALPTQDANAVAGAVVRGIERDAEAVYPSWAWRVSAFINHLLPVLKPITQGQYRQALEDWPGHPPGQ